MEEYPKIEKSLDNKEIIEPNINQQNKLINYINSGDVSVIDHPESSVSFAGRQDFFEDINAGKINDVNFREALSVIACPINPKEGFIDDVAVFNKLESNRQIRSIIAHFSRDNMGSGMDIGPEDLSVFYKKFPDPLVFDNEATVFLKRLSQKNTQLKVEEYKASMDEFQKTFYGKRYEYFKQIKILKNEAELLKNVQFVESQNNEQETAHIESIDVYSEGSEQAIEYYKKNFIVGNVKDGFFDAGSEVDAEKLAKGEPVDCNREILFVDREKDYNLKKSIEAIKIKVDGKSFDEKVLILAQEVFELMGGRKEANFNGAKYNQAKGEFVKLGDIGGKENPGMCRHRSLLFQIFASECGVTSDIIRGHASDGNTVLGRHAWNEVFDGNKFYLIDTMNPPAWGDDRFVGLSPDEFDKIGGFPRGHINEKGYRVMDVGKNDKFNYLNLDNQSLYTTVA